MEEQESRILGVRMISKIHQTISFGVASISPRQSLIRCLTHRDG